MSYPEMIKISQQLDEIKINDLVSHVTAELDNSQMAGRLKSGARVAITAGSRGITDIVTIVTSVANWIKAHGGDPFLIPAMGSHGGATAEGQTQILEGYGLSDSKVGAPIVSSMEVNHLGETKNGIPVMLDRNACNADHIIVLNRVKPHTEFHGKIESGLIKMIVIGLGKHKGTIMAHRYAVKYGYEQTLTEMGLHALKNAPISLGLAIIENGYGQTAQITGVEPEKFLETEMKLLEIARNKTPKLPFNELDILMVDECGKEISGTGMDTKVLGRIMNIYEEELKHPKITRVILRDITEKTHGNALGVGLADFITRKAADKIDYRSTYINSVTAITPEKARLPIVCENDREAVDFALATAGPVDSDTLRMVHIKNTSKMGEMWISKGLINETQKNNAIRILGDGHPMQFDGAGNLLQYDD